MTSPAILIVDDEPVDRYLLKRLLGKTGFDFHVFEADDGKEGLEFLSEFDRKRELHAEKFPPILIFLDINMPVLDGFEFLKAFEEMRGSEPRYGPCIVMMFSSSSFPKDHAEALEHESVKGYLVKGDLTPTSLRTMIEQVLPGFEPTS